MFEIRFVEHEHDSSFYQLGRLFYYVLKCELFTYTHEVIDTGIPEIDANYITHEMDIDTVESTLDGAIMGMDAMEVNGKNLTIETAMDSIFDFGEVNVFGSIQRKSNA
jgi:hypothetical protein